MAARQVRELLFLSTTGTNFALLKGFADWGINPAGSLVKGNDSNFCGMTNWGSTYNYGAVFMTTPVGQVTILKQFNYTTDGGYPYGELTIGADGNFYGMTSAGGIGAYGAIFTITPTGMFTVLKNFSYADGASPHGHLLLASGGGTFSNGTAF